MNLDGFKSSKPYPTIKVIGENSHYANLIQLNYAGMVSELSAILQYVNHETRLFNDYADVSKTLEKIAEVEMTHLEILGKLIILLGETPGYWINKKGKKLNWTPDFVNYGTDLLSMLNNDLNAEEAAIKQYKETAAKINDINIVHIINRIILDEEVHVEILKNLINKYS